MEGKDEPALLASDKDILKQKIENELLDYQKRFRSSIDNQETFTDDQREKWENTERDYFCLLQREGISYQALVEKILSLRQTLMNSENKYIWILQGKYSMDEKEHALEEIARWRRQLERLEKLYFILRSKQLGLRFSKDNYQIRSEHSEEDLLEMILSRKMELMKLEDECLGLLETKKTYSSDQTSLEYSEEELRRAVISRREFLVLKGEYYKLLQESSILSADDKQFHRYLEPTFRDILEWKSEASWYQRLYPSLGYDFSIDSKINLLGMIVPLRKEFIMLEDEYLYILQDRYAKNLNSQSLSDIEIIHSQYVQEHLIITLLRWRNDLRMIEDRILHQLDKRYMESSYVRHMSTTNTYNYMSHTSIYPSTLKDHDLQELVLSSKSLKEQEERYYKLVQERYLVIHNSISSIDGIGQIHSKKLNQSLRSEISSVLQKARDLHVRHHYYEWPNYLANNIYPMEEIDKWREDLWYVEFELFYLLERRFSKNEDDIISEG